MNRANFTKRNAVVAISLLTIQVSAIFYLGYATALNSMGF